ncbi:hypothetical protein ES708_30594 [subsurface metagenome]
MPIMKSVFILLPILGGGSISSGFKSITSCTESARTPRTVFSPSRVNSTTIIQVSTVCSVADIPNFSLRSTTGTTLPLRLITPRMKSGVCGTLVMLLNSKTSWARETSTVYSSLSRLKVRYCLVVVISATLMFLTPSCYNSC